MASEAMIAAIYAMKEFNDTLRSISDSGQGRPIAIQTHEGPLDPKKLTATTDKNFNTGMFEVVAIYKNKKIRRVIRLNETFETNGEAQTAARRIGREIKSGARVIELPALK